MKKEIATKAQRHKVKMKHDKLPNHIEELATIIVNSAFKVHKELGQGLLERIYETCFCYELEKAGIKYQRQIDIPFMYDNIRFDEGLRLDVIVENQIICELKAVDIVKPVWEAQILSHLKLTNKRLGFLINFNVPLIKDGINRFIL